MKHKVLLLPDAFLDIKEILDWYNFARKGLGKKFYDSLKLKIKSISINPLSFQLSYKESRSATLDNFPFQIHYWLDELIRVVIIYAIAHTRRNPKVWKYRN